MNPFQVLAHKYDIFNAADIPAYVEFIRKAFEKADIDVREVLDVGCGTGVITVRLVNPCIQQRVGKTVRHSIILVGLADVSKMKCHTAGGN